MLHSNAHSVKLSSVVCANSGAAVGKISSSKVRMKISSTWTTSEMAKESRCIPAA